MSALDDLRNKEKNKGNISYLEMCILDRYDLEQRASVEHLNAAHYGAEELAKLREEIAEIHEERVKVLNEQCAPDELHCTCVPTLRDEIKRIRADLESAIGFLKMSREFVEYMVGIASAARPTLAGMDEFLARIEGGDK